MTLIERIRTLALDPHRATDMARFGPFPSFTPAMKSVVTNCEKRLGFALPTFLRRLYLEVGNGGFGPGYGLLGIGKDGSHDDLDRDLVAAYRKYKKEYPGFPEWKWPDGLLPFCYYGCAWYACVDCTDSKAAVVSFDPSRMDRSNPVATGIAKESITLEAWFRKWIRRIENPEPLPTPKKTKTTKRVTRMVTRKVSGK